MTASTPAGELRVYRDCWVVLGAWMAVDTVLARPVDLLCTGCHPRRHPVGCERSPCRAVGHDVPAYLPGDFPAGIVGPRTIRIPEGRGIAVVVMGVAAVLRGAFALDYPIVPAATVGLAVIQPFVVNASTKLVVRWFPARKRATVLGVSFVAPVIGVALGSGVNPTGSACPTRLAPGGDRIDPYLAGRAGCGGRDAHRHRLPTNRVRARSSRRA